MIRATRSLSSEAGLAFTTSFTIGSGAGLGIAIGRTGAGLGATTRLTELEKELRRAECTNKGRDGENF